MHAAALHLAPVLAAEKSKVPFYVAGGVLVAWALVVSLGFGLRRVDFPDTLGGERAVMAITAVLVLGAVSTAVITSGTESKAGAQTSTQQSAAGAPPPGAPATSTTASTSTTGSTSTTAAPPTTATSAPAPAPGATTSLTLAADPNGLLSYDSKQLSAKAGTVMILFTNNAPLEHNVTIAKGATVLGATPTFTRASRTLSLKLAPGKYTFYCSVPGHRQAGMEGTLSVS